MDDYSVSINSPMAGETFTAGDIISIQYTTNVEVSEGDMIDIMLCNTDSKIPDTTYFSPIDNYAVGLNTFELPTNKKQPASETYYIAIRYILRNNDNSGITEAGPFSGSLFTISPFIEE